MAEEGCVDERCLPTEQPFHVPINGETLGLLRNDASGTEDPRNVDASHQETRGERTFPIHGLPVQPPISARGHRGARWLPIVHETLRRRSVGGRYSHHRRLRPPQALRRIGGTPDAPPGISRGL